MGIDVHERESQVCILSEKGEVVLEAGADATGAAWQVSRAFCLGMRTAPYLLRVALLLSLAFPTACATSRAQLQLDSEQQQAQTQTTASVDPRSESPAGGLQGTEVRTAALQQARATAGGTEPLPVLISSLPGGWLRLSFPASPPHPGMEKLSVEEIRPLLAALRSFRPPAHPRLRLMLESPGAAGPTRGPASPWELRLREEFLSQYGPALLPLPESLESSRLALALKLSTRYMDDGIREAAQELEAATTRHELEAASERFGKSVGGTALRVLVVVASLGMPQVLPKVPKGGLETLLSPLRHAPAGGPALESLATTQIVADGTVVVTGVAAGTSAASLCGELATCAMMNGAGGASGGGPRLSTRYGKPHTRQNPPHNEAIEEELARREAAGHTDLRKNKPQQNASRIDVYDRRPTKGIGFRKPDASSIRPDGIRHNTNYVSNSQDLQRELDAFDSMVRADKEAIHELYRLDGTLVRRYVPPGVSFP